MAGDIQLSQRDGKPLAAYLARPSETLAAGIVLLKEAKIKTPHI